MEQLTTFVLSHKPWLTATLTYNFQAEMLDSFALNKQDATTNVGCLLLYLFGLATLSDFIPNGSLGTHRTKQLNAIQRKATRNGLVNGRANTRAQCVVDVVVGMLFSEIES